MIIYYFLDSAGSSSQGSFVTTTAGACSSINLAARREWTWEGGVADLKSHIIHFPSSLPCPKSHSPLFLSLFLSP